MTALELVISFLAGAASFLSPCIIPMIIVYLTTISGFSFDELLKNGSSAHARRVVLSKTAVFVLAFTLVFTAFGALAGTLAPLLGWVFSVMSVLAGLLFLLLGLHHLGLLKRVFWRFGTMMDQDKIESFASRWKGADGTLSYAGVFAVGFIFALVCSHCISPTLLPALAIAASAGDLLGGGAVMLAFSLGLGLTFMLAAIFFEQTIERLGWIEKHKEAADFVVGIIFLLMGLLLLSGQYLSLVSLLYRLLPTTGAGM